jgi:hypothetical protein
MLRGSFIGQALSGRLLPTAWLSAATPQLRHVTSPADDPDGDDAGFSGRPGSEDGASEQLRGRLLDAALGFVKLHGWSHAALVAAAGELQLSPAVTGLLKRWERGGAHDMGTAAHEPHACMCIRLWHEALA